MHRRVSRRDRGVALIEGAIVFPLLMALTFGIIEFGLLFSTHSTSLSAAQAGARRGAAEVPLNINPIVAYDTVAAETAEALGALTGLGTPQRLLVYRAQADGAPVGGFDGPCTTDCRSYTWDGSGFVYASGAWASPDACLPGFGSDTDPIDVLGVYVEIEHDLVTGFFFDKATVTDHTTAQLEPLPREDC